MSNHFKQLCNENLEFFFLFVPVPDVDDELYFLGKQCLAEWANHSFLCPMKEPMEGVQSRLFLPFGGVPVR
jgi:hypothetical protein